MTINDILDGLIAGATADKNTLDALIAQLQHTTITSSDDELYDAPTFEEETNIWILKQNTANVGGLYVGCYTLPVNTINSYITNVSVVTYNAPSSPTAPATITASGESPVDLTGINDLVGQSFNSFCIRSTAAFEINIRVSATNTWCKVLDLTADSFNTILSNAAFVDYDYNTSWTEDVGWKTLNGGVNYSMVKLDLSLVPGLRYVKWLGTGDDFYASTLSDMVSRSWSYLSNERNLDGTETLPYLVFGRRNSSELYSITLSGEGDLPSALNIASACA